MGVGWRRLVAGLTAGGVLLTAGCASFSDQPEEWRPQDQVTPQSAPEPQVPGENDGGPGGGGGGAGGQRQPRPSDIRPPEGCTDFHPAVIGTCMDRVTAVAALPGNGNDPTALVGERATGRILRVKKDTEPKVVAVAPVDASTGGGLTGLALSPTYAEDQLIFAYITTPTDNRLVRIAPGDTPKPVLTGIPRGPSGNRGALSVDHRGALLVATGDAGNPALANNPASLAGKVLRVDPSGKPAQGNPDPTSPIVADGLHSPGGVCASLDGSRMWVTDRGVQRDLLYQLEPGKPLTTPAWSWSDRPGVAGCVSTPDAVWVAMSTAGNLQNLPLAEDGSFSGKPAVSMAGDEGFGRLGGMDLVNDQVAVGGTVNKDGGTPVSSDDRAVTIVVTGGNQAGGPD
ncbi:PQQ-dependent sugar dehydrogenase [Actinophytocola gossypii]|uniref:PQQ-dependent sugar dehydrogenase n=1 Tax=Actinophytocola gossypii TaxID=2812003 RepID=A0ABT2JC92_9PSEU|nr:PQQ-dependent sugar dehydrogenase [Actinophytocola gossypii]MCT2584934.1 PQQ-dependent sugar dehydrogenase [Actinophytocola gossypii]